MGIPRSWLYEIVTYDAADLLGGIIGVVSTALSWNRAETETFAKLVFDSTSGSTEARIQQNQNLRR